jgi:hypothetical protein
VDARVTQHPAHSAALWRAAVVALHPASYGRPASAAIEYDDGEEWTGSLEYVYVLRDDEEDEEAQAGHHAGRACAAPHTCERHAQAAAVDGRDVAARRDVPIAVGQRVR